MNRGIRNCNPLNIRRSESKAELARTLPSRNGCGQNVNIRRVAGTTWKGEIRTPQPPLGGAGFVQFESMEWGIRAAFCLLRTYERKYHLNCIADIISRWAPPSENDTSRYICNICRWTGFGGMQRLTESDWPTLVRAMARQETGVCLSEEQIQKGLELYRGIEN